MKKLVTLLLVLALALGMSTASFAVINKVPTPDDLAEVGFAGDPESETIIYDDLAPIPGEVISIPLQEGAFTGTIGNTEDEIAAPYTSKMLRDVSLRTRIAKGASALDHVSLVFDRITEDYEGAGANIEIEFVSPFRSNNTDGLDFSFWVYPVVDGRVWNYETYGQYFEGNLCNEVTDVTAGTDYIDMYNGKIANVVDSVRNLEYDLGPEDNESTVMVVGRAVKGAKYWGVANTNISDAQDAVMTQYKIDQVFNLDVINLDKVADHVKLDVDGTSWVYDADLKYLGRGGDNLSFSPVYYISANEIIVEEEVPEDLGGDDLVIDPPITGGYDDAPAGPFDNPSTGK
jgi:hypothetical protein